MHNIKKTCTRLAVFSVIGAIAVLSTGCEIVPYNYHHDEGYHGYHRHWHHRHHDDDDFRGRWK